MINTDTSIFKIQELKEIINMSNCDYLHAEFISIQNEFKNIVKRDSLLDSIMKTKEVKIVGRIDSLVDRGWLFQYKDTGHVLRDIGNNHWLYICSIEELILDIYEQVRVRY